MPGLNETGLPNTNDYNLGRGIVYFAPLDPVTQLPLAYRDLGNAPEFSISIETETLEHQSSRAGLKVTDKEVLISQKVSLSLTLDEMNFENLASLLSGEAVDAPFVNPAIAGFADIQEFILPADFLLGRWYDLKDTNDVRVYDLDPSDSDPTGAVTLDNTDDDVNLVLGTDFIMDLEMGRVFFLTSSIVIQDGDGVDYLQGPVGAAKDVDEVRALTKTAITGALKFIGENPANNDKQVEFQFHKVSLKAEGDFALIGDEFSTMQFTAVAEQNILADPDSPTLTIRTVKDA